MIRAIVSSNRTPLRIFINSNSTRPNSNSNSLHNRYFMLANRHRRRALFPY